MNKNIGYILIVLPVIFICLLAFVNTEKTSTETDVTVVNSDVNTSMDFENPFNSYIAFKNDLSNKIDKEEMVKYWNDILNLKESTEFTDFKIIFSDPDEYDKQYFMLSARSIDGTISIGSDLNIQENMFLLSGSTCTCTTSDCSSNGCEVSAGSGCSCTWCSGTCTKTHVRKDIQ